MRHILIQSQPQAFKKMWEFDGYQVIACPEGYYGFVYEITVRNPNGEWKYIGQKRLHQDWGDYHGDGALLKEFYAIWGYDDMKKKILSFHKTKSELSDAEAEAQRQRNVIESDRYLNLAVGGGKNIPVTHMTALDNAMKRIRIYSAWRGDGPGTDKHVIATVNGNNGWENILFTSAQKCADEFGYAGTTITRLINGTVKQPRDPFIRQVRYVHQGLVGNVPNLTYEI